MNGSANPVSITRPNPADELPMPYYELEWPTFAHDALRTGYQPMDIGISQATVATLGLHWAWNTGDHFYASPIVADGVVYVVTTSGLLSALNATNGTLLWQHSLGAPVKMTPAYFNGVLYVGTYVQRGGPSTLFAIDASGGSTLWSTTLAGGFHSSPVFVDGMIYVGLAEGDKPTCAAGGLYMFNAATGEPGPSWLTAPGAQPDGGGVWGAISADREETRIYFGTGNTCNGSPATANSILAITSNATAVWSDNTAKPIWDDDVAGGIMIFHGRGFVEAKNGRFYSVDLRDGRVRWSDLLNPVNAAGGFGTPSLTENTVIIWAGFGDGESPGQYPGGRLYGLSYDGAQRWLVRTHYPVPGGYIATTSDLAFTELDNSVVALDPLTGKTLWQYPTQGYFDGSPAVTPEGIFAADKTGVLYAFAPNVPPSQSRSAARSAHLRRAYLNMRQALQSAPSIPPECREVHLVI